MALITLSSAAFRSSSVLHSDNSCSASFSSFKHSATFIDVDVDVDDDKLDFNFESPSLFSSSVFVDPILDSFIFVVDDDGDDENVDGVACETDENNDIALLCLLPSSDVVFWLMLLVVDDDDVAS